MAASLEGTVRRYIGTSKDGKPTSGGYDESGALIGTVPPGSSFFETDTFRIARWDGTRWAYPAADPNLLAAIHGLHHLQEATNALLEQILNKL